MARYIDADLQKERILNFCKEKNINNGAIKEIFDCMCGFIDHTPTADVVPRSEVDTWYQLYHSIKEELKLEKMYHRETENLCDRYCIESQQAKKQVAREIFEEIEKHRDKIHGIALLLPEELAELKKKYTEGKDEQASIQTDHKEEFKK